MLVSAASLTFWTKLRTTLRTFACSPPCGKLHRKLSTSSKHELHSLHLTVTGRGGEQRYRAEKCIMQFNMFQTQQYRDILKISRGVFFSPSILSDGKVDSCALERERPPRCHSHSQGGGCREKLELFLAEQRATCSRGYITLSNLPALETNTYSSYVPRKAPGEQHDFHPSNNIANTHPARDEI